MPPACPRAIRIPCSAANLRSRCLRRLQNVKKALQDKRFVATEGAEIICTGTEYFRCRFASLSCWQCWRGRQRRAAADADGADGAGPLP